MDSFNYLENIIVTGKESKVYLATGSAKTDKAQFVFKGYREDVLNNPAKQNKLLFEINSLWKLSGKDNILQIFSEQYRDRMVLIITEYCQGGNLGVFLKNNGTIAEQQAIVYLKQIVNGYKSINEAGFIHRNLEPSNIFISGSQLKIGDFSDAINQSDASFVARKEEIVGSLLYQAPQILTKYSYSVKSDIYAIGLIFLAMLTGKSPFSGQNKAQVIKQMKNLNLQKLISSLSPKSKLFLEQSLQFDIKNRMDYQSMVDFQFQLFPAIPLTKFFTFDVSSPKFSLVQSKHFFPTPKESEQLKNTKELQKKSSKSISNKSRTFINIKVSDEFDVSQYNKSVSIMVPPRLDINFQDNDTKKQNQSQKSANPQHNISIEQQLSLVYLNDKTPSSESYVEGKSVNVKNAHEKQLKNSSSNKFKLFEPKARAVEKLSFKKPVLLQDLKLNQLSDKNFTERPKIQERARFTGRTLDTQRKRMEETNGLQSLPLNESNNKSLKVVVHSSKSMVIGSEMTQQDNIASWMVSQIDMARFLSRVIYRVQKLRNKQDDQLCNDLFILKQKILKQTKQLKHLNHHNRFIFEGSSQHAKLMQIIEVMQEKMGKPIPQIVQEKIANILFDRILGLYHEVKGEQKVNAQKIIALDYMISCWLLIKILKKQNLENFHLKSKLDLIMQNQIEKITVSTVLKLYDRMKSLGMIPE